MSLATIPGPGRTTVIHALTAFSALARRAVLQQMYRAQAGDNQSQRGQAVAYRKRGPIDHTAQPRRACLDGQAAYAVVSLARRKLEQRHGSFEDADIKFRTSVYDPLQWQAILRLVQGAFAISTTACGHHRGGRRCPITIDTTRGPRFSAIEFLRRPSRAHAGCPRSCTAPQKPHSCATYR